MVGHKSYRNMFGPHGLGRRNKRGQIPIDVCERSELVTNTWFQERKRIVLTGRAPEDRNRHELDSNCEYRFRNSIKLRRH